MKTHNIIKLADTWATNSPLIMAMRLDGALVWLEYVENDFSNMILDLIKIGEMDAEMYNFPFSQIATEIGLSILVKDMGPEDAEFGGVYGYFADKVNFADMKIITPEMMMDIPL